MDFNSSFAVLTFLACVLSGCGADVASTAAATARLQATQVERAKAQEDQLKKNLEEAVRARDAAASAAGAE